MRSMQTSGTVVGYAERETADLETIYRPIVEFTPVGASGPVRLVAKGGQRYRMAAVGATVRITYDPQNPQDCMASSAMTRTAFRTIAIVGIVFALLIIGIGLRLLVASF